MLYLLVRGGSVALGLLLAIQSSAIAQTESGPAQVEAAKSIEASPVDAKPVDAKPTAKVKPQFKVRYGNDGGDFKGRGLGQVETFVPLGQVPGRSVTFGEAKLNLDDHVGGNLRLGYRQYLPGANRIVGGYFGYDHRSTGSANFGQLGLGFETLGDVWDLRLNGYVPVGSTRQQVGRSETPWVTTGTGGLINTGNVAFRGNALQEIWQQNDRSDRSRTTIHQAALGGVELEGGAKLLRFENGGDLRAYAGGYSLSGQGADSTIGWKLRLAAKPASGLTMGLGVQSDGIFGTNVLFNIGYGWPNALPKGKRKPSADVLARLGDGVERRDRISVDRQVNHYTETIATTSEQFVTLTNPVTHQPWFFNHVVSGGTGVGNGTAESPFNGTSIQSLLDGTPQNGIVYIAKGTAPLAGFNVPGGIQVLSQGPVQSISTEQRGDTPVTLPNSGQGVGANPLVIGGETVVRVASNPTFKTVLSGFDIQSSTNASSDQTLGISISETLGEVQIRNNRISDVDFGIEQVAGSSTTGRLMIQNNEITADDNGIGIGADADGENPVSSDGRVQIYNNTITAQRDGVALVAAVVGTLNGNIDIVGNQIKAGEFGIIATAIDGGMFNSNLLIDDNRIDLTPSDAESIEGILVDIAPKIIPGDPPTQGEPSILGSDFITITNNSITSTTGADYGIALILRGAPTAASGFESFPTIATDITVSNNTFSLPFDPTRINQADGIVFGLDQMRFSGNLAIVNNSGSVADDGISYNLTPTSVLDGTISIQGNTITPGSNLAENHEVEACDESWWGSGTVDSDVPVFDACPGPLLLP
jgi:Inverse autotransporter, beta-domain